MKHFLIALTAAATVFLMPVTGWAEEFPAITVKVLKAAIESGSVTVIDVNGSTIYKKGHIPTAIDFRANKGKLEPLLPKNKEALIVAYCGGPECNAYRAAAESVQKLGYKNIKRLDSGIVGWIQAGEPLAKSD